MSINLIISLLLATIGFSYLRYPVLCLLKGRTYMQLHSFLSTGRLHNTLFVIISCECESEGLMVDRCKTYLLP